MDGNSSKTSSSSSSNGLVVPEAYLEGLALETFVLEALLKRHRCSHGRTIYFRRMDMVRKRLTMTTTTTNNNNNNADRDGAERRSRSRTRPTAMVVVVDAVCRLEALQKDTNQYHREQNRKTASLKRRRQTEDDERWDLQTLIQSSKSKSNNNNNNNNKQSTETTTPRKIANDLRDLVRVWTVALPELLSRIQHAGNALFKEASRGFFLPFCTTALSALARIRSFLMEIGARGLDKLKELEFSLSDSDSDSTKQQQQQQQQYGEPKLLLTDDVYKHCMDLFVENQNDHERQKRSILQSATDGSNHQHAIVDRTAILRSLGLTESASASASEFASTGKATSRAAPTTTAMTSDGVVEVDDSNADTNQRKQSEESENNGDDDDDDDDDYHTLATTTELQDESGLGELVDDSSEVHSGLDSNSNSNPGHHNDSLDRNMALVQKFRKRKSKNETKKSQQSSNEPDKKPKKKKKSVAEDADTNPKKRKSKTAKDPTKTKKKKKTKKEKGGDFFDDIFG